MINLACCGYEHCTQLFVRLLSGTSALVIRISVARALRNVKRITFVEKPKSVRIVRSICVDTLTYGQIMISGLRHLVVFSHFCWLFCCLTNVGASRTSGLHDLDNSPIKLMAWLKPYDYASRPHDTLAGGWKRRKSACGLVTVF